ncbi:MAG TPA: GNAT family N-acetyltransferase [Ramlibacter sp.]|nr:GNAT family N-acetyltransferase [Ramlibacter sp.]
MTSPGIALREEPLTELRRHVAIPNVFESRTVFDVVVTGGNMDLCETSLQLPFRKDYDALENPLAWPVRFDTSNWVLIAAYDGDTRVGGVIGAFDTPGVDMLEGRNDLVVIWDLRVAGRVRRQGIGASLFRAVEDWGRSRGCREMKVETQNANVAACKLYAQQGCMLAEANFHAYPDLPDEVQLLWRKTLPA